MMTKRGTVRVTPLWNPPG